MTPHKIARYWLALRQPPFSPTLLFWNADSIGGRPNLSAAGVLAQLTRASDPRTVEAAVAGEFIERLSRRLRGISDDRVGARMREVVGTVQRSFPIVN